MKINKCPWCKLKGWRHSSPDTGLHWVQCFKCDFRTPNRATEEAAVKTWNSLGTEEKWAKKTVRKIHRKLSRAAGESMGGDL